MARWADSFENAWYSALESTAPWAASRAQLERRRAALEYSLLHVSSVPAAVRAQLTVVHANVRRGKGIVAKSTNFGDLMSCGYAEVNAAFKAYGNAAVLVGDACRSMYVYTGPRVAPSPELARDFASIADWACGPQQRRCRTSTVTSPRSGS